jgi:hypothetical protein
MQNYLFVGGTHDCLNIPVTDGQGAIQLPVGVMGEESYIRDTVTLGAASITIYRHESLAPEEVLNRMVVNYKAWAANRPGGRRR